MRFAYCAHLLSRIPHLRVSRFLEVIVPLILSVLSIDTLPLMDEESRRNGGTFFFMRRGPMIQILFSNMCFILMIESVS